MSPHPAPDFLGDDTERSRRLSHASPVSAGRAPRRRILVVDDNVDAAESMAMVLQLEGHQVQTLYDGGVALEVARDFQPDVILLDIGLSGGQSGYDLAPQMRKLPGLENTLLVAFTGYGQEEDKRRALDCGFHAHLTKPPDLAKLKSMLATGPLH